MALTYTLIASNTLGSSAASVTFSSIPGTYTDLVLRGSARISSSSIAQAILVQFNSITGLASFTRLQVTGGTTVASNRFTSLDNVYGQGATGANATSNTFSNFELYIPSYTASQNKPTSTFSVTENNATSASNTDGTWGIAANLVRSTAAVTSLTLTVADASNIVTGSSFWLYGISSTV